MNHAGFIIAAYGLFAAVTLWLTLDAALRAGRARRRLAAIDPRLTERLAERERLQ